MTRIVQPILQADAGASFSDVRADLWRPEIAVFVVMAMLNNLDRTIMSGLLQPIKLAFALSDAATGALSGVAFGIAYATLALPLARVADLVNRRVLLAVSLGMWSVLTVTCGLTVGFWSFFVARLGVGIFEAAGAPALNALCADCFPADRRSIAASVLTVGYWAGAVVGVSSGGIIADHAGWRAAFLVAGVPGMLLAPVAFRYLREPRPSRGVTLTEIFGGAALRAYAALFAKRGFRNLLFAIMALALWYWGTASWYVTYLVRSYHLSLSRAAFAYGILSGASTLVGLMANALIGDRLVRRDVRWLGWLPGVSVVGCLLFAIPVCLVHNSTASLVFYLIASAFTGVIVPAILAATYAFAGRRTRASGVAAYYFCFYLVGLGFGAAVVGMLSDRFAPMYAQDSLRMALLVVTGVLPLSAWFFFRSAKYLAHDVELA